jgi:Transposase, Mutator family
MPLHPVSTCLVGCRSSWPRRVRICSGQWLPRSHEALMGAEADAVCGAPFSERSSERRNTRNGYRRREWDTRAGSIELAIPKLRQGSYFPDSLLERRRRAEATLVSVVATSCLLGGQHAADGEARRDPRLPGCPSRRSA